MAQHGYLREYDEDFDRDDDRNSERERGWRDDDRGNERNRNFMLGDRDRRWERSDRDRGFFGRMGDDARSLYRDDDREARGRNRQGSFGGRSGWERSPRNFGSHQDDHYRSWRDKQIDALDRDYADYCREREQQFHNEFDSWRQQRQSNQQPLQTGMTQSSEEVMELNQEAGQASYADGTSPMGTATLGTTSSPEGSTGRGRRS